MKLIYVAGPYTAPTHYQVTQNIRAAEEVAVELWRRGFAVICPHKNTAMLDGAVEDGEKWLQGGLEMLRRCDAVVVVEGWEGSEGTKREIEEARALGMRVYYWPTTVIPENVEDRTRLRDISVIEGRLSCRNSNMR